jgi:hypothetical protein
MANRNKSQQGQRTANEKRPRCAVKWKHRWQRGKRDTVVDMTGGAPLHTPHYSGPPPPPPIKGRMERGVRIHLSVVDHDELISTVRELRVQFRTPPPPLKAEWQGGSGMHPQP